MDRIEKKIVKASGDYLKWDLFLNSLEEPPFEQSTAWAYARKIDGWNGFQLAIERNDKIVIGTQILVWEFHSKRAALINQGPCIAPEEEGYLDLFLSFVKGWVKENKILYLVWDINYLYPHLSSHFIKKRFKIKSDLIPPNSFIKATLILDLLPPLDDILSSFKKDRRSNIKKGLKSPVNYRMGSRNDIPVFFNLMHSMCDRKNINPTHKNIQFFYELWDRLILMNGLSLHIAEYNDEAVCAMLCFSMGKTFRAYKWGWNGKYTELKISHLLYWKTIEFAKNNGFKKYDFVQVDPDVARQFSDNKPMTDELIKKSFYGPTNNKLRYSGEIIYYPKILIYFSNSFLGWIVNGVSKWSYTKDIYNKLISWVYKL